MFKRLFSRHRLIVQAVVSRRTFCEASKKCWNCSVTLGNSSHQIFCLKCEAIQNVPKVDYFELFELRKNDPIDANVLTTKFRKYQSFIHPDKFSGKSDKEQELSSEWSSLINKAYTTLQSPLERGEYLLRLHDVILPEDNTINDPEFLSEMMERNEEVDDATTKEAIQAILVTLRNEMSQLSDEFAKHYQIENLEWARTTVIKMKYLTSIEKAIKEKLLRL